MKSEDKISNILSLAGEWKKEAGYRTRNFISTPESEKFSFPCNIVEYILKIPPEYGLAGKKIFFFSDLHCSETSPDPELFSQMIGVLSPDWIVFGGDLVTYACFINSAFSWLEKVFANYAEIPKIAVPGNWDRRRKEWFPQEIWYKKYETCGFKYLVNESEIINGIQFYGTDEPRCGSPATLNPSIFSPGLFHCLISHNSESVLEKCNINNLPGNNLILCGHTHGGQVRIPLFGALITSTKYWKLFEYGHYSHKYSNTEIITSSGIGVSRIPFRLFCQPEAVIITLEDSGEEN